MQRLPWVGLHSALVEAAQSLGVRFTFNRHISEPRDLDGTVVDATGVFGASRRRLPHRYSGFTIYRGLSSLRSPYNFATYRPGDGNTYLTMGDSPDGASWAYFLPRPEPKHLRTHNSSRLPREVRDLPEEFRTVAEATPTIAVSPMSDWHVPAHMHDGDYRVFTVGDVDGPVRPVTTSGANLAVMEGFLRQSPSRRRSDHGANRRARHAATPPIRPRTRRATRRSRDRRRCGRCRLLPASPDAFPG